MNITSIIVRSEIIKNDSGILACGRKRLAPDQDATLKTGIDTSDFQLPFCEDHLYRDPEYPIKATPHDFKKMPEEPTWP